MTLPANTLPKPAHVKAQTKQILLYRKTAGSALGISRRRTHCFSREMDVGKRLGDMRIVMAVPIPSPSRAWIHRLPLGSTCWKREQSMRQTSPSRGGSERPSASNSKPFHGKASSAVQPLSVPARLFKTPSTCTAWRRPGKSQSRNPQRSPRGWTWPPIPEISIVGCAAGLNSGRP